MEKSQGFFPVLRPTDMWEIQLKQSWGDSLTCSRELVSVWGILSMLSVHSICKNF